jgi:hypothetical protein
MKQGNTETEHEDSMRFNKYKCRGEKEEGNGKRKIGRKRQETEVRRERETWGAED